MDWKRAIVHIRLKFERKCARRIEIGKEKNKKQNTKTQTTSSKNCKQQENNRRNKPNYKIFR